jgi:hypothetical protein
VFVVPHEPDVYIRLPSLPIPRNTVGHITSFPARQHNPQDIGKQGRIQVVAQQRVGEGRQFRALILM